jgi:hypothetical protein
VARWRFEFSGEVQVGDFVTIEITEPELEALIEERLQTGAFKSVEEVLLYALRSGSNANQALSTVPESPAQDIVPVFFRCAVSIWISREIPPRAARSNSQGPEIALGTATCSTPTFRPSSARAAPIRASTNGCGISLQQGLS